MDLFKKTEELYEDYWRKTKSKREETSTMPFFLIPIIVSGVVTWKKVVEEEETKRYAISAEERKTIHMINVQRDLLMTHLERSFDERRENFRKFFDSLDRAIDKGDTVTVAATLNSIVELAQSSPFKDIASVKDVREVMADQDKVYEI